MIYVVNPRGNDLHTAAMQSIDTMSIPQERERERRGGGGGASKYKIEARQKLQNFSTNDVCYSSESIGLCEPSIYENSHRNVHVSFKN